MKNFLILFCFTLLTSFLIAQPVEQITIDTIKTVDPGTGLIQTKIIKKVRNNEERTITKSDLSDKKYRIDTIITFDPNTYEEKIKIVKVAIDEEVDTNVEVETNVEKNGLEEITIDTIITFDPDTREEKIKIVKKRKIKKKKGQATEGKQSKKTKLKPIYFPQGSQEAKDNALILKYIKEKGFKNVQFTEDGLYYIMEKEGEGGHPSATSKVKAHYHGELLDGTKFDSSYDRNQPLQFRLGQVIKGWGISIPLLKPGGKGKFIIPSNLAYGQRAVGKIPPNAILIFDIELLSFVGY